MEKCFAVRPEGIQRTISKNPSAPARFLDKHETPSLKKKHIPIAGILIPCPNVPMEQFYHVLPLKTAAKHLV